MDADLAVDWDGARRETPASSATWSLARRPVTLGCGRGSGGGGRLDAVGGAGALPYFSSLPLDESADLRLKIDSSVRLLWNCDVSTVVSSTVSSRLVVLSSS